jgi:hypothetical protein
MKCKICDSDSSLLFKAKVLNKYDVGYYRCSSCFFIETEKPYWLSEAYSSAIADLDVGLVNRNIEFSNILDKILDRNFKKNLKCLDYGGGYGLFVRLMRDKGYDFYRHDLFCQNIFAKYFNIENIDESGKFDLLTSFEVFEHLEHPIEEIKKMFTYGDNVFFSTMIIPNKPISKSDDWWYFIPETGQHISFYSIKSLEILSSILNVYFYTNGLNLHLFTKDKLVRDPFKKESKIFKIKSLFAPKKKITSLVESDLSKIKDILMS